MHQILNPAHALVAALAMLPALGAAPVAAQVPEELVSVQVLPGWRNDRGTWTAGIRFDLAPGWKTYWRRPGEAGIPPEFSWDASQNVAAVTMSWPVPHVFDQAGMRSIGYTDSVVFPVEVMPSADGVARLAGQVDIGVCREICIPVTLDFAGMLTMDGGRDPAIVAALVNRPQSADEAGVTGVTCAMVPTDTGATLTATLVLPVQGAQESVVIETPDPMLWVSDPEAVRNGDRLVATAEIRARDRGMVALDRGTLRFTVLAENRAVDILGCTAG